MTSFYVCQRCRARFTNLKGANEHWKAAHLATTQFASRREGTRVGEFSILGRKGDTRVIWDRNNTDEVEAARRQFNFLVKEKKAAAFEVLKGGEKGTKRYYEFDPNAEKMIIVPQMGGGASCRQ